MFELNKGSELENFNTPKVYIQYRVRVRTVSQLFCKCLRLSYLGKLKPVGAKVAIRFVEDCLGLQNSQNPSERKDFGSGFGPTARVKTASGRVIISPEKKRECRTATPKKGGAGGAPRRLRALSALSYLISARGMWSKG